MRRSDAPATFHFLSEPARDIVVCVRRRRMFIGIDLGTTNSSLAVFDGEAVSVVPNAAGENLTPSVVRLDPRGNVIVGRRARAALESDPASTRSEWKRLMGTAELLSFGAAPGRALSPQELS